MGNLRQALEEIADSFLVGEQKRSNRRMKAVPNSDFRSLCEEAWQTVIERDIATAVIYAAKHRTEGDFQESLYQQAVDHLEREDISGIFDKHMQNDDNDYHNSDAFSSIKSTLLAQGFYEETIDCMIGHVFNQEDIDSIWKEFVSKHPADAFIYASAGRSQNDAWNEDFWKRCLDTAKERLKDCLESGRTDDAYEILDAYRRINDLCYHEGESNLNDLLTEEALQQFTLRAELYQLCLEADDSFYWDIGKSMLDETTIEEFPEEAQVLAYEAGEEELAENVGSASLLPAYAALISQAQRIVRNVERTQEIDLPNLIKVGGPKGSYATIRQNRFGEEAHGT